MFATQRSRQEETQCGTMPTMNNYYSRSPPPLQHPVPTHPAYIPEPPSTPGPGPGPGSGPRSPPQTYQYQPRPEPHIPDFAAWGMNDATAQFGMHLGQSAVAAGQDYVQKNVCLSPTGHAALLTQHIARGVHPSLDSQAPFQCLEFLCHQKVANSSLPLEAQTVVTQNT